MNRKFIAAALAAIMALSGCSSTDKSSSAVSDAVQSAGSSSLSGNTVAGSQSSVVSSTASSLIVSGEQNDSSSVSVPGVPSESASDETPPVSLTSEEYSEVSSAVTTSDTPPVETPPQTMERDVIVEGETRTLSGGKTFFVYSGEMLDVEGTLVIESGSTLKVQEGAELRISGDVQLEGKIALSAGGKLSMVSDKARIDGGGSVAVCDNFEQIDCERGVVKAHIAPPERVVKNGVTTVGGVVIANKAISLPPEFGSHLSLDSVEPEVYAALQEMCTEAGHQYVNRSGFRSYWNQLATFQSNVELFGFERADVLSARAGHSEHQTGLTMDLDSFDQDYGTTVYGKWLAENCWRYGFIVRYPKGKEQITGYEYEPWHVRYLGKSTAKLVFDSGLTLEEFLNVEGGTVVID